MEVVANIAGIASLALELAPHLYNYFADVKSAEQDVKQYSSEIYAFIEVSNRLHKFLTTDAPQGPFDTTQSVLVRTVVSCEGCLHELARLLKSPVTWTRKLQWPIRKKRVETIVERLSRSTQLFQFALTVEGFAVLSQTPEDVKTILQLQFDASNKLHEITRKISALDSSAERHRTTADQLAAMLEGIRSIPDSSERLDEIQEGVGNITRRLTDDRDVEILDWLSPHQARRRHHEIRSRRAPGTGKWIFNTSAVCSWLDESSPPKLLWLTAPPGCGKSTLLSLIIDELQLSHSSPHASVAYYYCDYRSQDSEPLVLALGSMLRSLVERLGSIPDSLIELFERTRREGRTPLPSEFEAMIESISVLFSRCYILVDAMDEFSIENPSQINQLIGVLDRFVDRGMRVMVTSRTLPQYSLTAHCVVEKIAAPETDIRSYVSQTLQSDASLIDLMDPKLERDITNTVVEHANGMFLLAVLNVQNIRGQVTRSGVRKALAGLSGDLGGAYDKTFEAIKYQSEFQRKVALRTLMFVSASCMPLSIQELCHALATNEGDEDLDVDNIPPMKVISRICCGLIAVDDLDNPRSKVRLVHHTLHQYLETRQPEWFSRAHRELTCTCLTYLSFKSLGASKTLCSESDRSSETHPDAWTLTSFATKFWGYHAARASFDSYGTLALRYLKNTERIQALSPENPKLTGLHVAATFGLSVLADALIQLGYQVDVLDSRHSTPLHTACMMNHLDTAVVLLKAGAKPDHWSLSWSSPLFNAVANENQNLVETLLDYGARVDLECHDQWTPLHKAADTGNLEIVRLLKGRGASVTRTSMRGLTALHRAAGRGHVEVIEFLIQHRAQVERTTSDGWTPLHGAASSGQSEAVKVLIKHGANVHHESINNTTALHRACQNGSVETVRALIEAGADVMVQDTNRDLPLHIAAREGHDRVIDCLIEHNPLQLSQLNKAGWSIFQEAQLSGFGMEKLLKYQQQSLQGENQGSEDKIVTVALQADDAEEIQQLLDMECLDIESRDSMSRTLLQRAVSMRALKTASLLLENGADIQARSEMSGWQPLHYAALSGSPDIVRLCLEHGANINGRTLRGQTPLHHACRAGNEEIVQILLDNKADCYAVDDRDWGPLHTAAAAGHATIVDKLLMSGVYGTSDNYRLQGVQACAAQRGHHGVVELIRRRRYYY